MTFDPTKAVQTVSGCKAQILMTDRPSTVGMSIVAMILTSVDGALRPNPEIRLYMSDGRSDEWCQPMYPMNLINVPPTVVKKSTFQNIYEDCVGVIRTDRSRAATIVDSKANYLGVLRRDFEDGRLVKAEFEETGP